MISRGWRFGVLVGVVLLGTLVLLWYGCSNGGGTVAAPTPVSQATPAPVAVTATVVTPPTPPPGAAPAELSYVVLNDPDGDGVFCALSKGGTTAWISYASMGIADTKYGTLRVDGIVGKCVAIPKAKPYLIGCGDVVVQMDVNQSGFQQGRHIGHATVRATASSTCPQPTPTPTPTPSPTPTPCVNTGRVTATATTNAGDYDIWDGTARLVPTFHLNVGQSKVVSPVAINGHTLTFKYQTETLASVAATCPEVQPSWHGTLVFACSCEVPR